LGQSLKLEGKYKMVVIRLSRGGAKKRPFYHVVVTDHRNRRDGRYIERIGYFNPVAKGIASRLEIMEDRVSYWLENGAQMSERVASLVKQHQNAANQEDGLAPDVMKKVKKPKAESQQQSEQQAG
jgi:small subunit ribosomal protein S16